MVLRPLGLRGRVVRVGGEGDDEVVVVGEDAGRHLDPLPRVGGAEGLNGLLDAGEVGVVGVGRGGLRVTRPDLLEGDGDDLGL